jgi:hypothetical protein
VLDWETPYGVDGLGQFLEIIEGNGDNGEHDLRSVPELAVVEKVMDKKEHSSGARVYCTLFDSYYLSRGLLMLESLRLVSKLPPRIYVFCFDEATFTILTKLALPGVIPVSLKEFETEALLRVKQERTKGEYCWTCTPHVLKHVLEKRGEPECTYLDADLFFYADPDQAIPNGQNELVLITEHRYTPEYDQSKTSGRFCVQFVTFKNEPHSQALLKQWGDQCLEWCFARHEEGRFGDQFYLDAWPEKGTWVVISKDPRVGVAPWNIQQYGESDPDPYFYHFHAVKWFSDGRVDLGGYRLAPWVKRKLYLPYVRMLVLKSEELKVHFGVPLPTVPPQTRGLIPRLKYRLKGWIQRHKLIHISEII